VDDMEAQALFRAEPLHDRAISMVRDMIVKGQLKPDAWISEKELCDNFGISRTPLREALKVLASEGLVELLPRRGAKVTSLSRRRLEDQFRAVALIEADAARSICQTASNGEIRKLRTIHDRLVAAFKKRDAPNYYRANEQFHRALVVTAGNEILAEIHAALVVHLHRARFVALTTTDMNVGFAEAHDSIIAAIESRDAQTAAAEVGEHQLEVAKDVLSALDSALAAGG
jgi:DNA-binding GntR family transcriptional regulator